SSKAHQSRTIVRLLRNGLFEIALCVLRPSFLRRNDSKINLGFRINRLNFKSAFDRAASFCQHSLHEVQSSKVVLRSSIIRVISHCHLEQLQSRIEIAAMIESYSVREIVAMKSCIEGNARERQSHADSLVLGSRDAAHVPRDLIGADPPLIYLDDVTRLVNQKRCRKSQVPSAREHVTVENIVGAGDFYRSK